MIIVDSREKKNQHILSWFNSHKIEYIVKKMEVADYQIEGNDKIVVDRKQNLDELTSNLLTKDKRRFYNEMRLAYQRGQKVIVLCEHGLNINSIADIGTWQSKHSKTTGKQLRAEIERVRVS